MCHGSGHVPTRRNAVSAGAVRHEAPLGTCGMADEADDITVRADGCLGPQGRDRWREASSRMRSCALGMSAAEVGLSWNQLAPTRLFAVKGHIHAFSARST